MRRHKGKEELVIRPISRKNGNLPGLRVAFQPTLMFTCQDILKRTRNTGLPDSLFLYKQNRNVMIPCTFMIATYLCQNRPGITISQIIYSGKQQTIIIMRKDYCRFVYANLDSRI